MKNSFTTLNNIIENMDIEDPDLTDLDDDGDEKSQLQFEGKYWFQGVHKTTGLIPNKSFVFNKTFEMDQGGCFQTELH